MFHTSFESEGSWELSYSWFSRVWWPMPGIPAFKRLRQDGWHKFSLGYRVRSLSQHTKQMWAGKIAYPVKGACHQGWQCELEPPNPREERRKLSSDFLSKLWYTNSHTHMHREEIYKCVPYTQINNFTKKQKLEEKVGIGQCTQKCPLRARIASLCGKSDSQQRHGVSSPWDSCSATVNPWGRILTPEFLCVSHLSLKN